MSDDQKVQAALVRANVDKLRVMLERSQTAFAKLGGKYINHERIGRIVMSFMRKNSRLAECDPRSILIAVVESISVGLEPCTPMQLAFLVPYEGVCQLQISWRGFTTLVMRNDRIRGLIAHPVFARDEIKISYAPTDSCVHNPYLLDDPGDVVGAYAQVTFIDGRTDTEWMPKSEILKAKAKARGSDKPGSAWNQWFSEMARKVPIKRGAKHWVQDERFAQAIEIDNSHETGVHEADAEVLDIVDHADANATTSRTAVIKRHLQTVASDAPPVQPPAPAAPAPATPTASPPSQQFNEIREWQVKTQRMLDTISITEAVEAMDAIWDDIQVFPPNYQDALVPAWRTRGLELQRVRWEDEAQATLDAIAETQTFQAMQDLFTSLTVFPEEHRARLESAWSLRAEVLRAAATGDAAAPQVAPVTPPAPPTPAPAAPPAATPAASPAPMSPHAQAADFGQQIIDCKSLRALATLGVKISRAGLPKEYHEPLQAAYQARKQALGGRVPANALGATSAPVAPAAPDPAPGAQASLFAGPSVADARPQAPPAARSTTTTAPVPPAAPVPAAPSSTPAAAPPASAPTSQRWIAMRPSETGGREVLGYVSGATHGLALDNAERRWPPAGTCGVMAVSMASQAELQAADAAEGRMSPTSAA